MDFVGRRLRDTTKTQEIVLRVRMVRVVRAQLCARSVLRCWVFSDFVSCCCCALWLRWCPSEKMKKWKMKKHGNTDGNTDGTRKWKRAAVRVSSRCLGFGAFESPPWLPSSFSQSLEQPQAGLTGTSLLVSLFWRCEVLVW